MAAKPSSSRSATVARESAVGAERTARRNSAIPAPDWAENCAATNASSRVSRVRRVSDGWSIRAASSSTDVASGICPAAYKLWPSSRLAVARANPSARRGAARLSGARAAGASPAASRFSAAASIRRAR